MKKQNLSEEIKYKIINAYNNGNSIKHLADIFNCHRNSIRNWINQYKLNGNFARKTKPGSGRIPKINDETGRKLLEIIKKPASKYGFETDFWTTSRIVIVCKKELKIKVSRMAVFRTLKKFKYSYKKPQKRYYEADTKQQQKWVKNVVPKIKKKAKELNAILYFEDESNISLSPVLAKSWGPIGEKIIQKVTGKRGSISAISAISNDGRLIFNLHDSGKRFNSEDIITFLGQILKHHKRRHIVLVMDNAPCHTSKKVKKFIDWQKRLHVFFCP